MPRSALGRCAPPSTRTRRAGAIRLPRSQSNLAQLKDETLRLRLAQDDTATEIGSLRAGVANSEIRVDSLRATTGEIRQQIERIEAARDATGSIARSHKHQGHRTVGGAALRRGHYPPQESGP